MNPFSPRILLFDCMSVGVGVGSWRTGKFLSDSVPTNVVVVRTTPESMHANAHSTQHTHTDGFQWHMYKQTNGQQQTRDLRIGYIVKMEND